MQYRYTSFLLLFLLLFFGCQPTAEDATPSEPEDNRPVTTLTGKVVLPAGATISPGSLTVVSSWSQSPVANTTYSLDVIGKFSTLFATNQAGEIMLMRYNYPGQQEYDLSPQSTAVALLMTSPVMQSLTEEGRLAAIQRLLADATYPRLVEAISASIIAGKPVTDPTNIRLITILKEMFNTAAMRVQGVERPKPIVIKRVNTTISLENNFVAHDYVAGLYKDGVKVGNSVVIKGTPMFASSVYEALKGYFHQGYSDPNQELLTLEGDGNFSLRIRSGRPGKLENTPEFKEARERNVEDYLLGLLLEHAPIPSTCLSEVRSALYSVPGNASLIADAFSATSQDGFNLAMLTLASNAFQGSVSLVKGCGSLKPEKITAFNVFVNTLGKYFKFLSVDTKIFAIFNITSYLYDLYTSPAAIDTCFTVRNRVVSKCDCLPPIDPMMQLLTSGTSQTWKLTGLRADPNQTPVTILGQAPTITFRADNTSTRTATGSSTYTSALGGGPPRTIQFNITGPEEGTYCLNRKGTEYGFDYGYVITSPNPNTLVFTNTSNDILLSTFLYHEELTYTKQ